MDMITLAMAKAYTDEKCGGGFVKISIPIADLYDAFEGIEVDLPANVAAAFESAVAVGMPVVVYLHDGEEIQITVLCNCDKTYCVFSGADFSRTSAASVECRAYTICKKNGSWKISVQFIGLK